MSLSTSWLLILVTTISNGFALINELKGVLGKAMEEAVGVDVESLIFPRCGAQEIVFALAVSVIACQVTAPKSYSVSMRLQLTIAERAISRKLAKSNMGRRIVQTESAMLTMQGTSWYMEAEPRLGRKQLEINLRAPYA